MQAQVIDADLPATNAVVHIIDGVLLPINLTSLVPPQLPVAGPEPISVQPTSAAAGLAASGLLAALAAVAAALLA